MMSQCPNGLGMMKWHQNDEEDFGIKGFALLQKYPSFTPIQSFPNHSWMMKLLGMRWKWMECPLNDIPPLSFSFLGIQQWWGMTEWGGMMVFLEVNKKLNSEIPLILPSFCHSDLIQTKTDWHCPMPTEWAKNYNEMTRRRLEWRNEIRMIEWSQNGQSDQNETWDTSKVKDGGL